MANSVKIYSTPTCVYCKMAREYFTKNGVAYQEFNVAEDDAAREEMVNKSRQFGVPVIDINNTIIVGFNRQAVAKALKLTP